MLMWSISFINAACLCLCRRVLLLAASVRQHVLPPGCSACLHDPADDGRTLESEGKSAVLFCHILVISAVSVLLPFPL